MGFTVIGGMLAASFIAIFLIPVMFHLVERLRGTKPHVISSDEPAEPGPTTPLAKL
jgi:HAE1 family hydrophobic/amphiphilic exporter-1